MVADPYLRPNSQFKRLWKEYHAYKNLIVACDLDDTLFDYHGNGHSYDNVIRLVQDLKEIGCTIIIWTANQTHNIEDICKVKGIPYDYINEDCPQAVEFWAKQGKTSARKLFCNVFIDDRSSLDKTYADLELLVWLLKNK